MKSETLIYGMELLVMLDEIRKEVSFPEFEEKSKIKGGELKELLRYLSEKEYLCYKLGLFVGTDKISESTIKLLPRGMEVVLGERDYFNETGEISQTIHNLTNVHNSSEIQIAQTIGNNNKINQSIDNSKLNVLTKLIEEDKELDEPKKKKLFGILEKFNTLKESGENALDLIKSVGSIASKYIPLFFGLLH
ncbi:MAG: hypothetical protein Q8N63_05685, partial [Nanoarchaeota archaeon]|nr:hypothetical protein [Nanoarchaeota archaeon]